MEDRMGVGMARVIFLVLCFLAMLASAGVAFGVVWLVDKVGSWR